MKFLFDENLAPSLVRRLADLFPGSVHVHQINLGAADDEKIWEHARQNGFVIATKDSDFEERVSLLAQPPKVVWIRAGNCSVEESSDVLRRNAAAIQEFAANENETVLILFR